MNKINYFLFIVFISAFFTFDIYCQKQVEVKIPRGQFSTTISRVTTANDEPVYNLSSVKAGQTITITVSPANLVIGLWVEFVEAEAAKGKLIYKAAKSQNNFDFQFVIGNARAGTKYKATVTIK